MPLARLIVVFAIVVLVIVGAFISHEILKDNLTEDQYIKLFWLAMGSVFFVAGIVFVNLAGKTTNKPKGRSPITQLLLANLGMIVFAGLMFFLFFLQFN